MASLDIRLLGDFAIEYDDDPLVAVDSVREQARNNLRKALHQLRHALPDSDRFLYVDTRTVQWRADALYTLDVDAFARGLQRAAARPDDPATQQVPLTEAIAHYRGDLLPSCYDEWIIPEQERLRQGLVGALEKLIALAEDRRDYAVAIDHANHLLRFDPLHEAAYRQLMRCHALNGDRAGALRVYHTCVAVVQRELGVESGQEVEEAFAHLLEMTIPTALCAEPAFPSADRGRLVGR